MNKQLLFIATIVFLLSSSFWVPVGYIIYDDEKVDIEKKTRGSIPLLLPPFGFEDYSTDEYQHIYCYISDWQLIKTLKNEFNITFTFENGTILTDNYSYIEGRYYNTTFTVINKNMTVGYIFNEVCYVPNNVFTNASKLPNYRKHRIDYTEDEEGFLRIHQVTDLGGLKIRVE